MDLDSDIVFDELRKLQKKHRELATEDNDIYQEGFADGIQESMNQLVGIMDQIRYKK